MQRNFSNEPLNEHLNEEAESDTVKDISVDDGVERMAGEGGVATEIPHEHPQFPALSSNTEEEQLEQ